MMEDQNTTAPIEAVDFSRYLQGTESEQVSVAEALDEAFRTTGFVYLSNHPIPQDKVQECLSWCAKFFSLPHEEKMKSPHPPGGSHHRGYSGMGVEKVSQMVFDRDSLADLRQAAPDVKESFESGRTDDVAEPNIWPPDGVIPGFQEFMESFYEDCSALAESIFACLALALSLPDPTILTSPHKNAPCQLRLLHYPAIDTDALQAGTRTRISAHSDFGTITLLFQDAVGGLEIEDPRPGRQGEFRPVAPRPDCVLVNVGDLLERWSNGRWKSTVHRVGAPPVVANGDSVRHYENGVTCDRYSIPFFVGCKRDTVVDALPGCWDADNPKKWEPITAWDYIGMRMAALY